MGDRAATLTEADLLVSFRLPTATERSHYLVRGPRFGGAADWIVSAAAAGDAATDGRTAVVAGHDVESLGGAKQAGHTRVEVDELDVFLAGDIAVTFRAVYHVPRVDWLG